MIDPQFIEQLKQLPIEAVAERLGMRVKNHKALCYAHPDKRHPNFVFDTKHNRGRCFSCGEKVSNPIDLCMRQGKMTFLEAVKFLSDGNDCLHEVSQPASEQEEEDVIFDPSKYERRFDRPCLSPECKDWLYNVRRYDPWAVNALRLTSWKDYLVFGYFDTQRPYPRLTGIEYRYMGNDPERSRFIFPKGQKSHRMLYNLSVLNWISPQSDIWLAEGPSDVIAHMSERHPCIGFASASLFRADSSAGLLEPLRGRRVWFAPDNDEPGDILYDEVHKAASMIGFRLERVEIPKQFKDYSDYHKALMNGTYLRN